ncbi:hypothetical protein [Hyphomicrobium sp. CS1BSMeth3]|uniref:hypothetical protein n=1 Tax=Hyphomicrobium sp. CS1BSMeth3 TaxID=1892844 RepID=UPI001576EFB7|nr:hypothetical protein [Hyphomicrobium sp. CS1BSMeth3]
MRDTGWELRRGGTNALFVVLDDGDTFARDVANLASPSQSYSILVIARGLLSDRIDLIEMLMAEHGPSYARCVVVGFGAAGGDAISCARSFGAQAVFAVAPSSADGQYAGLQRARGDGGSLTVHVLNGSNDDASKLAVDIGDGAVPIVIYSDVQSSALSVALRQSARLAPIMEALARGDGLPSLERLREEWRKRFHYAFELADDAVLETPHGGLQIRGWVRNVGSYPIDAGLDRILIGARLEGRVGTASQEPRGGFINPVLAAGERSAFSLALPRFDGDEDLVVVVSLVCDGRFWFDAAGFPAIRFAAGNGNGAARAAKRGHAVTARDPEEQLNSNAHAAEAADQSRSNSLESYKRTRLAMTAEATLDDVWYCYRLLLNREPDEAGFAAHCDGVLRGMAVPDLVQSFLSSAEFQARLPAVSQREPA